MSRARAIASDLRLAAENVNDARLLLKIGSRNAAYLASQAAEHVIRAVATSENLHIERKDAHRLDTTVRRIPDLNPDKPALSRLTFLEVYATTYRYPSPSGRISEPPSFDQIAPALDSIATLLSLLENHFDCNLSTTQACSHTKPRR